MEWKRQVRGFEPEATSDPAEAARRIQADDGMSTGIIYRSDYPAFQPGNGAAGGPVAGIEAFESELRI
jgi:2-oxoglutarate ferredoxin oxidoreductase subunit beta